MHRAHLMAAAAACSLFVATSHAAIIDDDFESGPGNWDTTKGYAVTPQPGNPTNGVLLRNSTGGKETINSTPIPAAFKATFDLQADMAGNANDQRNVRFLFHLPSPTAQANAQQGYHLLFFNGFGTDGFRLFRKDGMFGPETTLGQYIIPDANLDNLIHQIMVSDDGTGMISVLFDGNPIIQVDDSANYVGADGQYVGFYTSTVAQMQTFVDNFLVEDFQAPEVAPVPEPASVLAWLMVGGAFGTVAWRRRRGRRTA